MEKHKVGLSIYSLAQLLQSGEMTVPQAADWIADNGGTHLEIVSFLGDFTGDTALVRATRETAERRGIAISAYCFSADMLKEGQALADELAMVRSHIDAARDLGASVFRCDLASWNRDPAATRIEHFEADLPALVAGARQIADYAAQYGITVTAENHGMYLNGADRVRRLILAVDRENYRCTLDVGNSLCVDEDPLVLLDALLPFAVSIHFKDFYIRRDREIVGEGDWIETPRRNYLRGAIVGHGDLDVSRLADRIRRSGYGGWVAVEFEGMEDCRTGSKIGMDNVRRWMSL